MIKTFLISVVIDSCLDALDRTITRKMLMPQLMAYHASGRKLSAKFSIDEIVDISVFVNSKLESELMSALRNEIEKEIDDYIIAKMNMYSNEIQ